MERNMKDYNMYGSDQSLEERLNLSCVTFISSDPMW